jgi:hypothetical protein
LMSIQLEHSYEKEIEQIIGETDCPKGFVCYKSGFRNLCKARDIGLESFLECLEENPEECVFLLSFANVHFCDCLVRFYIAKKLGK